jgi:hypothetical protein
VNWHRLEPTHDGDDECTRCGVVVTPEAQQTFTLLCPQPPCAGDKNPDDACVFVPGRGEVCHCLYCGRAGSKNAPPPEPELIDLDLEDDELE